MSSNTTQYYTHSATITGINGSCSWEQDSIPVNYSGSTSTYKHAVTVKCTAATTTTATCTITVVFTVKAANWLSYGRPQWFVQDSNNSNSTVINGTNLQNTSTNTSYTVVNASGSFKVSNGQIKPRIYFYGYNDNASYCPVTYYDTGTITLSSVLAGSVTISPTEGTISYPTASTSTFTVSGNTGTVSVTSLNNVATASLSNSTVTVTRKSTGTGYIKVTSAASGMYAAAEATYTLTSKLDTYTVSYKVGDATSGTAPAAQTKTYGTALTLQNNTGSLAHSAGTGSTSRSAALTLSYNANGGSGTTASNTGTAQTISGSYTITYANNGWGTSSGTKTKAYDFGGSYTANSGTTLYPAWTTTNGTTSYTAKSCSATAAANGFTAPTGKHFTGWNTAAAGTGTSYAAGATVSSSITANKTITLYAQWAYDTYSVSYNKGDATSGTAPSAQTKTYGTDLTLRSNTGSLAHNSTTGTSNRTNQAITLSYNANGGTGAPSNNSGTGITVPGSYPITWTAAGWGTSSGTTTKTYDFAGTYSANAAATLYPAWSKSNGSTTYTATSASATISSTKPTKDGYTFSKWAAGSTSGTQYASGATYSENITASKTVTMYAIYTANTYNIYFAGNGGTNVPSAMTRTYGQNVTFPSTTPTRTGYKFGGWLYYGAGDSSSTATTTATSGTYVAGATASASATGNICWTASDVTYVATWEAQTYTISYNKNGGTGTIANQTKTVNTNLTLTSTTPSFDNSTFVGWLPCLTTAGSLIATINGRNFYKKNAGFAYIGYWYSGSYTYPLLVGETADSVAYYDTYDETTTHTSSTTFAYKDKSYYVSAATHGMSGEKTPTAGTLYKITASNRSAAGLALLNSAMAKGSTLSTDIGFAGSTVTLGALYEGDTATFTFDPGDFTLVGSFWGANEGTSNATDVTVRYNTSLNNSVGTASKASGTMKRTVTFNGNGGTSAIASAQSSSIESYTFNGWISDAYNKVYTSTGAAYTEEDSDVWTTTGLLCVSNNLILEPEFRYSCSDWTTITFPSATRDGYTIAGWTSKSGGTTVEKYVGDTYTPLNDNETWYAVWNVGNFTVTLHWYYGGLGTSITEHTQTITVQNGSSCTIPAITTLLGTTLSTAVTNTGYTGSYIDRTCIVINGCIWRMHGWRTNASSASTNSVNGTALTYSNSTTGITITPTSSINLYAILRRAIYFGIGCNSSGAITSSSSATQYWNCGQLNYSIVSTPTFPAQDDVGDLKFMGYAFTLDCNNTYTFPPTAAQAAHEATVLVAGGGTYKVSADFSNVNTSSARNLIFRPVFKKEVAFRYVNDDYSTISTLPNLTLNCHVIPSTNTSNPGATVIGASAAAYDKYNLSTLYNGNYEKPDYVFKGWTRLGDGTVYKPNESGVIAYTDGQINYKSPANHILQLTWTPDSAVVKVTNGSTVGDAVPVFNLDNAWKRVKIWVSKNGIWKETK